jgi:hypothetical protein
MVGALAPTPTMAAAKCPTLSYTTQFCRLSGYTFHEKYVPASSYRPSSRAYCIVFNKYYFNLCANGYYYAGKYTVCG